MNKIKILQFPIANSKGGITQYVLRNWKFIDKSRFQFDFATMSKSLDFAGELEQDGCKVYYISSYAEENKKEFTNEFRRILNEGNYDIVHLHTKQWKSFLVEQIAKEVGIKKIIIHAHSTGVDTLDEKKRKEELQLHNEVLQQLTENIATDFWACSCKAAEFIYGDKIPEQKIRIMNNAIDLSKYVYNPEIRKDYRRRLGIADDEYVIGNVGRFVYPKNQEFLINVFYEICNNSKINRQKYKLFLVGSGECEEKYKNIVRNKNLEDKVVFTGYRKDIPELLQAMDIFCLPSRFEGMPISLIEAQVTKLECVVSDTVTKEADISGNVYYRRLVVDDWINCILQIVAENRKRDNICEKIANCSFDIREQIKRIEEGYTEGIL